MKRHWRRVIIDFRESRAPITREARRCSKSRVYDLRLSRPSERRRQSIDKDCDSSLIDLRAISVHLKVNNRYTRVASGERCALLKRGIRLFDLSSKRVHRSPLWLSYRYRWSMDRGTMPIRRRHPGNVDGARRRRCRGAPTWSTLAPVFPLSLSHPLTPARGIKEKDIHRGGRSSPGQTATTLARRRSFARADSRVHRRVSGEQ